MTRNLNQAPAGIPVALCVVLLLAAGTDCVRAAPPATADSSRVDVYLSVQAGSRRLPVVVTQIVEMEPELASVTQLLQRVVEQDLVHSARFEVLVDTTGAADGWGPLMDRWSAAGGRAIVRAEVRRRDHRTELFASLFRLPDGHLLMARGYDLQGGNPRQAAHRLNDDIVRTLTGHRGIASTRIAYVAPAAGGKEVFVMDSDGYGARRLTQDGTLNLLPVWSPDGYRIAYNSLRQGNWVVYLAEAATGMSKLLRTPSPMATSPSWATDGRSLVVALSDRGNIDLYRVSTESGPPRRLTEHPGVDTEAAMSPDGQQLAFTSDRTGTPQIYLSRADGTDVRRLTWEPDAYEGSAAWSPDGRWIAFVRRGFEGFEVHVVPAAGGTPVRLTSGGNNENPTWSPDGLQLAFCFNESNRSEIWVVNRDGSQRRPLTTGGEESMPSWSSWPSDSD